jgi:hypothetical protein
MRTIAFVCIIILVTAAGLGTAVIAETTPVYPGMGNAPAEVLTNMYPAVKGNTTIMGFLHECGVASWREEQMNANFKSAFLLPANSCGKQLVFLIRKSAGRDDPTIITDVWIIGVNETPSGSMDTIYHGGGASPVPVQSTESRKAPGFVVAAVMIAIAVGTAFIIRARRNL